MLERTRAAGVRSMVITGGSLHESREGLELAKKYGFYATVGCHPTRSAQFDEWKSGSEGYLEELDMRTRIQSRQSLRHLALDNAGGRKKFEIGAEGGGVHSDEEDEQSDEDKDEEENEDEQEEGAEKDVHEYLHLEYEIGAEVFEDDEEQPHES